MLTHLLLLSMPYSAHCCHAASCSPLNTPSTALRHVLQPLLDVILFTKSLSKSMGYKGQLALYIYYLLSAGALRQLSPPLALMTAQESSLSGGFRAAHQVRSPCLQRSVTSSMYMLWSQMSYRATHHTSRHDKAVRWARLLPGTWIISLYQMIARTHFLMSFQGIMFIGFFPTPTGQMHQDRAVVCVHSPEGISCRLMCCAANLVPPDVPVTVAETGGSRRGGGLQ